MNWAQVKSLTIPEGVVSKVTSAGAVIWQKVNAALGMEWTQSNVTSGSFSAVAYGDGLWVAGGRVGIYYSVDGKEWTQSNMPSAQLLSVAYGGGMWVAHIYSDANYSLCRSDDGKTWTLVDLDAPTKVKLAYGDGRWTCFNSSWTSLFTSTDGETWENVDGPSTSTAIKTIAYGNGRWIVCADFVYLTEDFSEYVKLSETLPSDIFPSWIDDRWIGASSGTLWSSFDGENWASVTASLYPMGFCKFKDFYIALCSRGVYRSTDCTTWTAASDFPWSTGNGANCVYAIGNGLMVVVSKYVTYASDHSGTIWSDDADRWHVVDDNQRSVCAFGGGVFVTDGGPGLCWSDFKA